MVSILKITFLYKGEEDVHYFWGTEDEAALFIKNMLTDPYTTFLRSEPVSRPV